MKRIGAPLLMACLLASWGPAGAQSTEGNGTGAASAGTAGTAVTATNGAGATAEARIVHSFAGWAGSEENARSLVAGLRQGNEVTLTDPAANGGGVAFTPPTRPMGYGNVRISLALAQEQLAQAGISQPTPDQLRAALMGGTVTNGTGATEFRGVLQMRADGMGWGQIANSMGVKLGHVMSGRAGQSVPASAAGVPAASTSAPAATGVTTAAGAASASGPKGNWRGNGAVAGGAHRHDGIVNAAGGSVAATGVGAGARCRRAAIRAW
jgi:hypothetical protein